MAITDINFFTFWANNLPVRRRTARRIARGFVYMRPLQWLRDRFFFQYINGTDNYDIWLNISQYASGDVVMYTQDRAYYEVLPGVTPPIGTLPTDSTYWLQLQPNFVGLKWRQQSTAQKLKLQWYLNLYFQTNYNNPPAVQSDIYITSNNSLQNFFLVSADDNLSDKAVLSNGESNGFVGTANPNLSMTAYTINMPDPVFSGLATTPAQCEAVVRAQVDPRNLSGVLYDIATY